MKTKVLKYKFDGNTIVAPYMELEPYAENVFISLARKNEYGNESEDCFHVICKWKSHATLTLLAKHDCPLWLQYD